MTAESSGDVLPQAPPPNEAYRVAEYKRELVRRLGAADGFARFRDTLADASQTTVRDVPLHSIRSIAAGGAHFFEHDAGGYPFAVQPARVMGENDSYAFAGVARSAYTARLDDVTVCARSYVLLSEQRALLDYEADERTRSADRPELDAAFFSVDGDRALVLDDASAPRMHFDEAFVSLLSPHGDAFGHWMWHQLSRFVATIDSGALPPVPLLIDANMPPSHRVAVELVLAGRPYPIVEISAGTRVSVKRAWVASTPFYVPYIPVNDARWRWDFLATPTPRWTPILDGYARAAEPLGTHAHERLFFARRPHLRRALVNTTHIEELARARGFAIVYPEETDFAEQLRLLRGARFVVGPEGSAMFLNFFARDGQRLGILSHPVTSLLTNYTAPMSTRGVDVRILTGTVTDPHFSEGYPNFGYRHFADYRIAPDAFAAFLDEW